MGLTAKQRAKLPPSAFAYPSKRAYPVPTRAQAKKAGISERTRMGLIRNAPARAAQSGTMGSYAHVARIAHRRAGAPAKRRTTRRRRARR
jgi:hypothetical protein